MENCSKKQCYQSSPKYLTVEKYCAQAGTECLDTKVTRMEEILMAKFHLASGETMIGSGQLALHQKQFLNTKPFSGNIYVTSQRVCFYISMIGSPEMDLPLSKIKGFSMERKALFTAVTIYSQAGQNYVFTGFPVKKLQDWLRQAGVREL